MIYEFPKQVNKNEARLLELFFLISLELITWMRSLKFSGKAGERRNHLPSSANNKLHPKAFNWQNTYRDKNLSITLILQSELCQFDFRNSFGNQLEIFWGLKGAPKNLV